MTRHPLDRIMRRQRSRRGVTSPNGRESCERWTNVRRRSLTSRLRGLLVTVAFVVLVFAPAQSVNSAPLFVQQGVSRVVSGTTGQVALGRNAAAGDLLVAFVIWDNAQSVALSDTRGNVYTAVAPATSWGGSYRIQMFYAPNVSGGADTVSASYAGAITRFGILYVSEYSGVASAAPVDVARSAAGTSTTIDSGLLTTTNASDLLVAGAVSDATITAASAGYTARSTAFGNLTEDQAVTAAGSYRATASHGGSAWAIQLVAFKGTASAGGDTTAPSVPTGLAASGTAPNAIALSWRASTDPDDASSALSYNVYRDGTFLAKTPATTYTDSGLLPSSTHSYAVAATDPAGNVSAQSASVSATTLAGDTTSPTIPTALKVTGVTSSTASLSWTASTDNVAVTGYRVLRNNSVVGTASGTTYTDGGLTPSTTYTYAVAAYDGAGNVSAASSPANATTAAGSPSTAFPVKQSTNGRYLVDQNNQPFLMTGDSPQSIIGNLSLADANTYFADRQAAGFNTVWINLLCNSYTYCNSDGSTVDGLHPFSTPGNLSTPNEAYFARADSIIQAAASHGLLVLLDPIETGGWLDILRANGLTRAQAYGQYVGNRYRSFDNIVWINGNDFQTWQTASDDALARAVASGIQSADTRHIQTVELNYWVSASLDDASWASIIGLDSAYTYQPTYVEVLHEYNRSTKPVYLVEANYEFENNYMDYGSPGVLRRQEYWTQLSGATGQLYGNLYTVRFTSGWTANLDTPGAAQIGMLRRFFESFRWYDLIPDQSHALVTSGFGTATSSGLIATNDYATAARTADGTLAVVYLPKGRTVTVDMTRLAGSVSARWFDPSNGAYVPISGSPFANTGSRSFAVPGATSDGDTDWVLLLQASTVADTQPPTTPSNVTAQAVSASQINLAWAASTDNVGVAGYRIYRNSTVVATVSGLSFADTGLQSGTSYTYQIASFDAAGNSSPLSSSVVATTLVPDTSPPTTPANVTASSTTPTGATVTWSASSDNSGFIAGYRVFRNGTLVGTPSTTQFVDSGLTAGTTYTYTVTAVDASGNVSLPSAPATVTTPAGSTGPVVAYAMNEGANTTLTDSSGNSNNGTLSGSGVTWTTGQFGNGLAFNGLSGLVTIPDSPTIDLSGSFTLSAWIRPSALTGYQTILIKETTGGCGYWLQTLGNQVSSGFRSGTGCSEHLTTNASLPLNAWSYVSVVFDATAKTYSIYVNGALISQQAEGGSLVTNTQALVLGQSACTSCGGERWRGAMDEIRIYRRALTAAEIQRDMNTPL
jgi:chitodextrinase